MKVPSIPAATLMFACLTTVAFAGEHGIINQANPLDQTLRFYMHPAHFFLSSEAPHSFAEHPAVLVKRSIEAQDKVTPSRTLVTHPALAGREGQRGRVAQSQPGRAYPQYP